MTDTFCPLSWIALDGLASKCIEESCAWWINSTKMCAVKDTAFSLDSIAESLVVIASKNWRAGK